MEGGEWPTFSDIRTDGVLEGRRMRRPSEGRAATGRRITLDCKGEQSFAPPTPGSTRLTAPGSPWHRRPCW